MAPDGQTLAPNVYDAEPIPEAARAEIDRMLMSGDLFRYTAPADAPVALLEAEFAALLGSRYALAVSSCSAALFLSLKALDLPRGARTLRIDLLLIFCGLTAPTPARCAAGRLGSDHRFRHQTLQQKSGRHVIALRSTVLPGTREKVVDLLARA